MALIHVHRMYTGKAGTVAYDQTNSVQRIHSNTGLLLMHLVYSPNVLGCGGVSG